MPNEHSKRLLARDPFLKTRRYTVQNLFDCIEDGLNRGEEKPEKCVRFSSNKDTQDLRMNDDMYMEYYGVVAEREGRIKKVMKVYEFLAFAKECQMWFDV